MMFLVDRIMYLLYKCNKIERKLTKYQGYRLNSLHRWKAQTKLGWKTFMKLVREIKVYDGISVREILRKLVRDNYTLFYDRNTYITSFGQVAKSGDVILYDFRHAVRNLEGNLEGKIIKLWQISDLPSHSKIIFIDDLIGTGRQSSKYITGKLNSLLKPSHDPYLISLCATPDGIERVLSKTNFNAICGIQLSEGTSQYLNAICKIFNPREKKILEKLNSPLHSQNTKRYHKSLLIAFYFTVPNSTMPIIWKNEFEYRENDGERRKWFALLPRHY